MKRNPPLVFGTKAETLARLAAAQADGRLKAAVVLPLLYFSAKQWRSDPAAVAAGVERAPWSGRRLIVRSACRLEDGAGASHAGRFVSIPDVAFPDGFAAAVERVLAAYPDGGDGDDDGDHVLVQPMAAGVVAGGVAFSRDPNTRGPYIVVNHAAVADTAAVTAGGDAGGDAGLETFIHWKGGPPPADPRMAAVAALLLELEALFERDGLDVEYAFDVGGALLLLQVRPLANRDGWVPAEPHRRALEGIAGRVARGMAPDPFIHGRRTVYGVMPDWNPAEIIGVRPRPLALSLYRELVTDSIWAYQRDNYGYTNLRSHPLLTHFHGLPYIDVRASFNSFVPKDVEAGLAERLVNHYIDRLIEAPHLHDKVEFEIILSCHTPTTPRALADLRERGFSAADTQALAGSLRRLTNRIIHPREGLWRGDLAKLATLEARRERLAGSGADPATRIYWLLEDCKRYGTLPFAGLARAGFIAAQLLRAMVEIGVFSPEDAQAFMGGLDTVGSRLGRDRATLDRAAFLSRYGHLRPGTYDILSLRYDEAPDLYFDWDAPYQAPERREPPFVLTLAQMRDTRRVLAEHGLDDDVVAFLEFLKAGMEGREQAKFLFTRNLSDALSLLRHLGEGLGFSADDLSHADIGVVRELHASSADPAALIAASVAGGRARYDLTRQIVLPPLIRGPEDVWSFTLPPSEPNFITLRAAAGPVVGSARKEALAGAIVAIPNADPGFDWLFSYPIAGLVTAYGGVNSHMAIRAGELGLPAVIGAGPTLYAKWSSARGLAIDCANRQVVVTS